MDLSKYKTKHLFLLVGSNPLPNYVAAKLFADTDSQIYFIHTNETEPVAQNLARNLDLSDHRVCYIQVDDAESNDIFSKVAEAAKDKESIGLHYTGGTKAMSVHAYRAIQAVSLQAVFSYLNARNLTMLIDQERTRSKEYPVGLAVSLKIEELLKLHDYDKLKKSITHIPELSTLCHQLLQTPQQDWGSWCYQNLREQKQSGKTDFKNKTKLKAVELPTTAPFTPLQANWGDCITLGEWAEKLFWQVDKFAEFLAGLWLEHYVLSAIQRVTMVCDITDTGLGIEPVGHNQFEFDVVAMRGYQLFALSCTTSADRGLIKSKLFEAHIRARQMGGDEAHVAMVCYAPEHDPDKNPMSIQREAEKQWEGAKNKVRVFGEQHLPNLADHLRQWFTHSTG